MKTLLVLLLLCSPAFASPIDRLDGTWKSLTTLGRRARTRDTIQFGPVITVADDDVTAVRQVLVRPAMYGWAYELSTPVDHASVLFTSPGYFQCRVFAARRITRNVMAGVVVYFEPDCTTVQDFRRYRFRAVKVSGD